ncbi:MAG: RluA family pseudouridine synthase [Ignavibacteriae bacterium]|nr:RluA family pseudouridine synthase [Ignavibacteriota bacterium]
MKNVEIIVPDVRKRERLDVFLTNHVENATRSKVQQAIKEGLVKINGEPVKPSHKISTGEKITFQLPKPPAPDVLPENIPLDILFEDDELLVVNKPAGMVVHPAYGNYSGTLVNALLYHYKNNLSSLNDPTRPGIVHRLDKDTSGLMLVAKNDVAHAKLARQFLNKTIHREYWSIVWGLFSKSHARKQRNTDITGIVETSLGRSKSDRKKIAVTEDGKSAITEYKVIEEFEYLSLIQCKLRTGRTHQIRVHMHHIGHPVFGDPTYGGRKISFGETDNKRKQEVHHLLEILPRQALHAKRISFIHPTSKETMVFESELPIDISSVLKILQSH